MTFSTICHNFHFGRTCFLAYALLITSCATSKHPNETYVEAQVFEREHLHFLKQSQKDLQSKNYIMRSLSEGSVNFDKSPYREVDFSYKRLLGIYQYLKEQSSTLNIYLNHLNDLSMQEKSPQKNISENSIRIFSKENVWKPLKTDLKKAYEDYIKENKNFDKILINNQIYLVNIDTHRNLIIGETQKIFHRIQFLQNRLKRRQSNSPNTPYQKKLYSDIQMQLQKSQILSQSLQRDVKSYLKDLNNSPGKLKVSFPESSFFSESKIISKKIKKLKKDLNEVKVKI